jgi:hypothetical protein
MPPQAYTPAFALRFPNIITFVGTLDAVVTNKAGEQFRLLLTVSRPGDSDGPGPGGRSPAGPLRPLPGFRPLLLVTRTD